MPRSSPGMGDWAQGELTDAFFSKYSTKGWTLCFWKYRQHLSQRKKKLNFCASGTPHSLTKPEKNLKNRKHKKSTRDIVQSTVTLLPVVVAY